MKLKYKHYINTFILCILTFSLAKLRASDVNSSVMVCGGSMMNGNHFSDDVLQPMREGYHGCKTIALVLHASLPSDCDRMEKRLQEAFMHMSGIKAISLHHYDTAGQIKLLKSVDGVFVGGGETFVLLAELYRTGELDLIRKRVSEGMPYCGGSAGANVAGYLIGTTNDFPVAEIPSRKAMGIFPAIINPHHPLPVTKADYDARAGKIKFYLLFNPKDTILALANKSIARLHDGHITLDAGFGWVYTINGVRALKVGDEIPELLVKH
jgi:dipeptidase E